MSVQRLALPGNLVDLPVDECSVSEHPRWVESALTSLSWFFFSFLLLR